MRPPYDVIIVLGRGIDEDGALPPDGIARVKKAAELYHERAAPRIIVTGKWSYHLASTPPRTESAAMKTHAIEAGVPAEAIIEESESMNTVANLYFCRKNILEPHGWKRVVLVASEEHMPRIRYLAEMLLGAAYTITYVSSERVLSDKEYADEVVHETTSLERTKELFGTGGSDALLTAWRLITATHPDYAQYMDDEARRIKSRRS